MLQRKPVQVSNEPLTRYNAFAGMADSSNSFVLAPVVHFPWSDKGRERRGKKDPESSSVA